MGGGMTTNRNEQANRNRERMPNVAAVVDEFRKFFPDLKVIWAEDKQTGVSVGKKSQPENVWVIPEGFRASNPDIGKRGRVNSK